MACLGPSLHMCWQDLIGHGSNYILYICIKLPLLYKIQRGLTVSETLRHLSNKISLQVFLLSAKEIILLCFYINSFNVKCHYTITTYVIILIIALYWQHITIFLFHLQWFWSNLKLPVGKYNTITWACLVQSHKLFSQIHFSLSPTCKIIYWWWHFTVTINQK